MTSTTVSWKGMRRPTQRCDPGKRFVPVSSNPLGLGATPLSTAAFGLDVDRFRAAFGCGNRTDARQSRLRKRPVGPVMQRV